MMDCEQVRELEAAFALDALDAEERAAVASHLKACDEHDNVAELRAAGMLLGATVSERRPPDRLRARVLASAGASESASRGTPVQPRSPRWWYPAAAAVALLLVLGAAGAAILARDGESSDLYVKEFVAGDVTVRFEGNFDAEYSRATFGGLAPREDYHLWVIRGGDWLSVGVFQANPEGNWAGDFVFQTRPGDAICLTLQNPTEPSGPFGKPLFVEPVS